MVTTAAVAFPVEEAADVVPRARARTARGPAPAAVEEAAALPVALPAAGDALSRFRVLAVSVAAVFTGASLLHARPASMAQARAHHHEHGAHWTWPVVRWLRVGWGYSVHLPYRSAALALDLVFSSPAATVIVAALIYAFWHWH